MDLPVGKAPVAFDSSMKSEDGFSNLIERGYGWESLDQILQIDDKANWLMGMVLRQKNAEILPVSGYDIFIDGNQKNSETIKDSKYSVPAVADGTHTVSVDVDYNAVGKVKGQPVTFIVSADGIKEVTDTVGSKNMYDIQGRVITNRNGQQLFILGGKKYAGK